MRIIVALIAAIPAAVYSQPKIIQAEWVEFHSGDMLAVSIDEAQHSTQSFLLQKDFITDKKYPNGCAALKRYKLSC